MWRTAKEDCRQPVQIHHADACCIAPQVGEEVLGRAAKVEVSKENCTIVGDGSTQEAVSARVRQIKNAITNTEQDYEREKLNERVARLSGGVAILQARLSSGGFLHESPLHMGPLSHRGLRFCGLQHLGNKQVARCLHGAT